MGDEDPAGSLVYASATRTLDQQEALLENIQSRAGTLLGAASIVTTFLAGLTIRDGQSLTGRTVLASAAFIFLVSVCVHLLSPRSPWMFRFNVEGLISNCLNPDDRVPMETLHRELSAQMGRWIASNQEPLTRMLKWFRRAGIALGVEVAFWIADLVWRR